MDGIITALVGLLSQIGPGTIVNSGIVSLLAKVAPSIATSGGVAEAIKIIAAVVPAGLRLAREEIPVIKSIIATLRGNSATTKQQMDELDAFDAQCDAALDAAIDAAEAEDAATEPKQ